MNKKIDIYTLLGLIKDGKEPKKISIRGNIFDSYSCSSIECYYRDFNGTNWLDDIDIKLDDEVEILDEEDEFIDIEELYDNSTEFNFSDRQTGMTKEDRRSLDSNFKELGNKINDLIKNQKKIISKLGDNND